MLDNNSITEAAAHKLLPISVGERIESIDVMRGLAIFGVLIAYAVWNLGGPPFNSLGTTDVVIDFVLTVFVASKAYTLLAFLFGLGFSIQMSRAAKKGTSIVPVYCRRLVALIAIGLLHAVILRNGDILVPYATMGFVLLLFRNLSDRAVLFAAIASSFVTLTAHAVWDATGVPFPHRPETDGMSHLAANLLWVKYWYSTAITLWPDSLPMFFAGLYIGRRRVLDNVAAHGKALQRVLIGGFVFGSLIFIGRLLLIWIATPENSDPAFTNMLLVYTWNMHAWSFAAAYAATVVFLLQKNFWQRTLSPLASVGRMALTNYLLQAAVIVPLCIAFDLYDRVTPSFGLFMAALLWIVQVPLSVLWLKHFRFGPAEWVWRSLTYKRPQPMRDAITKVPHVAGLQAVE